MNEPPSDRTGAMTMPTPAARRRPPPGAGSRIGAALVTVVLWASAFVGIRAAGEDFTGGALVARAPRRRQPRRSARSSSSAARGCRQAGWPGLLVCGLLWFGVYNVALNEAERRVDAGTAAMLVNVGPILIALLAGVILHEGFPRTLLAGCAVAFAGVVVIGLADLRAGADRRLGHGAVPRRRADLRGRRRRPEAAADPQLRADDHLARVHDRGGRLPAVRAHARRGGRRAQHPTLAWTVYLGCFPTALAFTTWAYALRALDRRAAGALTYLVPPLAIVMGWAVLDEAPPAIALLGGALCLAGAALARRQVSGPA